MQWYYSVSTKIFQNLLINIILWRALPVPVIFLKIYCCYCIGRVLEYVSTEEHGYKLILGIPLYTLILVLNFASMRCICIHLIHGFLGRTWNEASLGTSWEIDYANYANKTIFKNGKDAAPGSLFLVEVKEDDLFIHQMRIR